MDVKSDKKIFICPTTKIKLWHANRQELRNIKEDFWVDLVNKLLENKYFPIIYQDNYTYDLTGDFSKKCGFVNEKETDVMLGAMRTCDCVLDMFYGLSRYA